jgi:hypothetical protein
MLRIRQLTPVSEAYIETSSNTTNTQVTSAASSHFQAVVGSQTGQAVTPTSQSFSAVASGSQSGTRPSGSSAAGASAAPSSGAGKAAGFGGFAPVVISLGAVALGMALMA